jgi:hypothetical protein
LSTHFVEPGMLTARAERARAQRRERDADERANAASTSDSVRARE